MIKPAMLIPALFMLLGACVAVRPMSPQHISLDRPPPGEAVAVGLGDVVLEREESTRHEGILLENEISWFDLWGLRSFTLRPGPLKAREADQDFTYYYSDGLISREAVAGVGYPASGGICVRKSDATYIRVFTAKGSCSVVPDQRPQIRSLSIAAPGAENYRQELIYRGKSGSTLDFVYRELRDDQPLPTLALDFHIDLADGPAFSLRGARIEVIEATNTKLIYRVLSSFADSQHGT